VQTLEGDWKPKRMVVTEFPNIEQARRWYDSEEYRALKALRLRTARAASSSSKACRAGSTSNDWESADIPARTRSGA
jgi:hypothetical protein